MDETPNNNEQHQHPIHRIPIDVTVSVGRARPSIKDLLSIEENAILPLDRKIDDPVELYVGDKLIALGELLELEDGEKGQLGIRLTRIAVDSADLA